MTQKNIIVGMIALAIIALVGWFVPVQQTIDSKSFKNYVDATLGGTTNFDDLDVDTITVGTSAATSSSNLGRACITLTTEDGDTVYWYADATGSIATSSVTCN